jgi:predicted phosphatase
VKHNDIMFLCDRNNFLKDASDYLLDVTSINYMLDNKRSYNIF